MSITARGLEHVEVHFVDSFEEAGNLLDWFQRGPQQHGRMAVDTESTGLSRQTDRVRLVQVGDEDHGWAIPCEGPGAWTGLFTEVMSRYNGSILTHNGPMFDRPMLRNMGVTLPQHAMDDTMVMAHILEPTMPVALKRQAARHVDPAAGAAQKDLDEAISRLGWDGVPVNFVPYWSYGALDPVLTCQLEGVLRPRLAEQGALAAYETELAVLFTLERMSSNGAPVDVEYAAKQMKRFQDYVESAAAWCRQEFGVAPGSNQKIIKILQDAGFQFTKFTESGALSLDKEVLEDIDHPLAKTVLKRRQLEKLSSTYLDFYVTHHINGRIHPSIRSLGARTGRMSMAEPNFQNLPRVSENNPSANVVRNCIMASPDHTLVFCDFSQIETRLLAHLSQDPGLIAAFHSPDDFFVTLARKIFQDATIGKKDWRRNIIKTLVYAKIYGAGIEKMAKTLGLPVSEVHLINNDLNLAYPGIKGFQDWVQRTAWENKAAYGTREAFVTCPLSGRRHYADPGKEYALVNYLIQGMAAFFFKTKLLQLDAAGLAEWMILPVHDEIILNVPTTEVPSVVDTLMKIMNDTDTLRVPVAAEVSYGPRWGAKKDWSEWELTA